MTDVQKGATRAPRKLPLLASTAFAALALANPALANCDVTASPNSVTCSATTTTNSQNSNAATASSVNRLQEFTTGGDVTGLIAGGVTVDGAGLAVRTTEAGASLTFTNSGAINQNSIGTFGNSAALGLQTSTGSITYNSASGATITASNNNALLLQTTNAAATGDLTAHINGDATNVGGNYALQIETAGTGRLLVDGTGSISGRAGIAMLQTNATAGTDGDITVSGSGNVTSTNEGIYISHGANAGTVTVNGTGSISAGNYGVRVVDSGTGGVVVSGVGPITMSTGYGIGVEGSSGATIVTGGTISAQNGISSTQTAAGTSSISSGYDITTSTSTAIFSRTANGSTTVNITGGTIHSTGGSGVIANATGSGDIVVNMTGGQIGRSSASPIQQYGIDVEKSGASGDIRITSGTIYSAINALVVRTAAGSSSSIDITANSTVAGQPAISSASTGIVGGVAGTGTNTITVNGDVSSQTAPGILSSALNGTTSIVNNARVTTATTNRGAIEAQSTTGAISIVNNAGGVLTSTAASPDQRIAVTTQGGATTLVNRGAIVGRVFLSNAANTFDNSGTWTTNGFNNFGTLSSNVTNSGSVTIGASGTINGTGISFVNNAGTLTVNGTINGTVTVTGGVLGGTGTIVGTTTVNNTGVLAPGNSIGTFNVTGNLVFGNGGIYRVEVSPTAADRTIATGTARLTGGIVQALAPGQGFTVGRSYTILTANGGLGGTTFAGLSTAGALSGHLAYDTNNVFFVIDAIGLVYALTPGTQNQRNVAAGIDTAINGSAPSGSFATLFNLSGAALGNAFDQLSGEVATGGTTAAFQAGSQFLSLMTSPFGGTPGNNATGAARGFAAEEMASPKARNAYAAVTPKDRRTAGLGERWGVWGASYGSNGKTNGESAILGSHDVSTRNYGVVAGADYHADATTTVGFAVGGGETRAELAGGLGTSRGDLFQLGLYGRHHIGAAYVAGAMSYGLHRVTTDRTVTISGTDMLTASFNGQSFGGRIEAGYRFSKAFAGITPYAALEGQSYRTPSYSESATSGSNAFALSYASKTTSNARTELGSWFDKTINATANSTLTLRARAAWVHDSATSRDINAAFQTLPGSAFTVSGAAVPGDAALVSLGADLAFANAVTLRGRLDGEFGSGARSLTGQVALRYAW